MGRPAIDLTGQRFGKLVALSRQGNKQGEAAWLCKCDCGSTTVIRASHLKNGQQGCGCIPSVVAKNLTGMVFGRLIAIERRGSMPSGDAAWLCLCTCGQRHVTSGSHLVNGDTTSCGCYLPQWKHGYAPKSGHHPLYKTWLHMRDRCLNPKFKQYRDYGGRGITVYKPWIESFMAFLTDVRDLYISGCTIDRIDPDGNYEPGNVRWATKSQQQRNRRKKT